MMLEIQRDTSLKNRIFIVIKNPSNETDNLQFDISLKQATNMLIKCHHDFRQMVSMLLCVKDGKICMKNMT